MYSEPKTGYGMQFNKEILLNKNVLIAFEDLNELDVSSFILNRLILINGRNKFNVNDLNASWFLDLVIKT